MQADEDEEEEDEFAERGHDGDEQEEEEEGSKASKEEQEPKAPAVNARARLLWERLGKEGTRRRRQERAEEMEALPGPLLGLHCVVWLIQLVRLACVVCVCAAGSVAFCIVLPCVVAMRFGW